MPWVHTVITKITFSGGVQLQQLCWISIPVGGSWGAELKAGLFLGRIRINSAYRWHDTTGERKISVLTLSTRCCSGFTWFPKAFIKSDVSNQYKKFPSWLGKYNTLSLKIISIYLDSWTWWILIFYWINKDAEGLWRIIGSPISARKDNGTSRSLHLYLLLSKAPQSQSHQGRRPAQRLCNTET